MDDERGRTFDLIVVGAGPAGIAVGMAAVKRAVDVLLMDQGTVCNTIFHFPERMKFFSTSDLLEFPGVPMIIPGDKPTRLEALTYFTRLAMMNRLPVSTFEKVDDVRRSGVGFEIKTSHRSLRARAVVLAIGTYDFPNRLDVPGETLDHVSHYYVSPQPYVGRKVLIIGGKNSAAEAALELYRSGAEVMWLHRGEVRRESIKYWILPDLLNRIAAGAIRHYPGSFVLDIQPGQTLIRTPEGEMWIPADDVLALIGYHPDYEFLKRVGIDCSGEKMAPAHNPETLESNIRGIYIAGVLTAGADPSKVFIENSRHHGEIIIKHLIESGQLKGSRHERVSGQFGQRSD